MAETANPAEKLGKVAVAWVVIIGLLALLGVAVNTQFMALFAVILAVLAGFTFISRPISIPFALSFFAISLVIVEYLMPDFIVAAFPDFGAFIGFPLRELNPLRVFAVMLVALIVMWTFELRRTERAVKPETITKRLRTRFEKLLDTYVTMGRIVAGFFLVGLFMLSRELGMLAGEFGNWLSEVPFIASTLTLSLGGWFSLGGELPIIGTVPLLGTMTSTEWAVFAFLVVFIAAAVKFAD